MNCVRTFGSLQIEQRFFFTLIGFYKQTLKRNAGSESVGPEGIEPSSHRVRAECVSRCHHGPIFGLSTEWDAGESNPRPLRLKGGCSTSELTSLASCRSHRLFLAFHLILDPSFFEKSVGPCGVEPPSAEATDLQSATPSEAYPEPVVADGRRASIAFEQSCLQRLHLRFSWPVFEELRALEAPKPPSGGARGGFMLRYRAGSSLGLGTGLLDIREATDGRFAGGHEGQAIEIHGRQGTPRPARRSRRPLGLLM